MQAFFVEMGLLMFASGHYATHQEHSLSASTLSFFKKKKICCCAHSDLRESVTSV